MKKHFTLFIPLLLMLFLVSGCYTKIARPGQESGPYEQSDNNYNEYYGYTHYYYPDYWIVHTNWGHYYAMPWWWEYYYDDGYYYYDDDDDSPRPSQPGQAVPQAGRWLPQPSGLEGANQINTGGGSGGGSTGKKTTDTGSSNTGTKQKGKSTQKDSGDKNTDTRPKGRWRTK